MKKSKRDFALHCTHVSQGYLRNLALTALPLSLGVYPYRMAKLTGSILIYYLLAQQPYRGIGMFSPISLYRHLLIRTS